MCYDDSCVFVGASISIAPVDTDGCYGGLSTFHCESSDANIKSLEWLIGRNSIKQEEDNNKTRKFMINTSPDQTNSNLSETNIFNGSK